MHLRHSGIGSAPTFINECASGRRYNGLSWPVLTYLRYAFYITAAIAIGTSVASQAGQSESAAPRDTVQSLAEVQMAVREFLRREHEHAPTLSISVSTIDPRLRLTACSQPLATSWSPGSRRLGLVTVKVQCSGRKPWRLHIQADVSRETTVWKLVRGAERGTVLEPAMITRKQVKLGREHSLLSRSGAPIEEPEHWFGHAFRQSVSAGQLLTERLLEPPTLVHRGDRVRVVHRVRGLEVIGQGIALADGARNERLQVKNPGSGKVIDATVAEPGVVILIR